MLVQTFLCTKYVAIPDLLYIQYRNKGGDNSTIRRNKQIQILVKALFDYYHREIYLRVEELGLPKQVPYNRVWVTSIDHPARKSAHIVHENSSKVSILFPIPHSVSAKEHCQLFKTLQKGKESDFKKIEVVVVAEIENFASLAPMGAIRWWPMEPSDSLESCIEYAKYCASSTEKVYHY